MSFAACLAQLKADGSINAERARRFSDEYERLRTAYGKTAGAAAADALAARDTLSALQWQALTKRRQDLLQLNTQSFLLDDARAFIGKGGNPQIFAVSVMEAHQGKAGAGVANRRAALWGVAHARMAGFFERYRRDLLGRMRQPAERLDIVRALRGEPVDNVAVKEIAAAVSDTFEWLRQQYNLAGGAIAKLDGWGLPQSHDAGLIARAGYRQWHEFIRPLIDRERMIDATTNRPFDSDQTLDEALEATWRNITSEGLDGAVPGQFNGTGDVANRRSDHRFLVFKDAESWLSYNDRFGTGDVFDAVYGHLDGMARDIAAMQMLGPNPAKTIRWLGDVLRKDALPTLADGQTPKQAKRAAAGAAEIERMWRTYTGEMSIPVEGLRKRARFFQGVRNWNVMAKLGGAVVTAVATDPAWAGVRAKFTGLSVTKMIGTYVNSLNPLDEAHRKTALHMGLALNEYTQRAARFGRAGMGLGGTLHEFSRRGADALLRGTLLTPHTVAAKHTIGLSWGKELAEHAHLPFDQLGDAKVATLERFLITAEDWDRLRALPADGANGVKVLNPVDLARAGDLPTALKFLEMMDMETRLSIPGERLRAQAMTATLGGAAELRRGTWGGELLYSATQFKTFSVIATMNLLETMLHGQGAFNARLYPVVLLPLLIMGGVIAQQMMEIFSGRNPLPMDRDEVWLRGVVRGGGLGFAGDFIGQNVMQRNDEGNSALSFLAGPSVSIVLDPVAGVVSNASQAYEGEDLHLGREVFRGAKNMIPGGNAWYARLALNRLMLDRMQEIADPDYRQSWNRMEQRAEDAGGGYYWAPGDDLSEADAPDLSTMFGETIQ